MPARERAFELHRRQLGDATVLGQYAKPSIMRSLAAVDTVHTAAAVSDYLGGRLGADDEVIAVTVHETDAGPAPAEAAAERDGQEALNVIGVRLAVPDVEPVERRGDVATELLDAVSTFAVDEIVLGRRAGTPEPAAGTNEEGMNEERTNDAETNEAGTNGEGTNETGTNEDPRSVATNGEPTGAELGATATAVLARADRPVVVLPSVDG